MRSALLLAALALGIAACGDGGDDARDTAEKAPAATGQATPAPEAEPAEPEPTAPTTKTDPADVRIVRAWADALRHGDVNIAARYFAVPSLVSNGTRPLELKTRAEVRFFNRTLPCGARLIGTEPAPKGFFIATFRLTERPGEGECGSGTGATARTAFRVRDEHITDWLRVQDIGSALDSLS